MEVLFRRATLACWTAILVLVVVVSISGGRPQRVPSRLQVVDSGADIALEQAAAIRPAAGGATPVEPTPVEAPSGPPPPGRLIISSIGVNAPVVGVGVDKDNNMAVTNESYNVGWYRLGTVPGEPGDAVIDGHLDWYDTPHAVFYNLKKVSRGDDIEVQRLDGITKHFRVTSVRSVAYDASVAGLFADSGPPRLTLITCGGPWSQKLGQYLERVIVDASLSS
ncbi:MAG: class F sortase [Candidatus Dormibacteria bacterium]